jgi:DNA-binding CsgD family transcriptional regulator
VITTGVVCRDFIGRRDELEFLVERVLHRHDARGCTILVRGDAGIGKSRLMREFADTLRARGFAPATGSCFEYGDGPYAPLLEIAEAFGASAALDALQPRSGDGEPATGRERMRRFAAFSTALAACARGATAVAIVENLQWADIATLELFRYLIGALREHPFVLVATLRSEDIGTVGRATTQLRAEIERSADATITLPALKPTEMRALLTAVLRDEGRRASSLALEKIAELSDGRPFHAEELLRGMLDMAAGDPTATGIPRSLAAAVAERLATLDPADREVLACAAVIGRHFAAPFLAELVAKPLAEVLLTLRRARNLQLVVEDAPREEFFFRHQLTREVAYEEILFAEARELHRRIVVKLAADPLADVTAIAYHAWRCGDRDLTVRWNDAAGDAAAAICAHIDAVRQYERAYDAETAGAARARLARKIARALAAEGDLDVAASWFDTAQAAAAAAGEKALAHAAALDGALVRWERGDAAGARAVAVEVAAALDDGTSPLLFAARTLLASIHTGASEAADALAALDAAAGLDCTPEPAWTLRHRAARAQTLARLGRLDESQAEFARTVAQAHELGELEQRVRALGQWGDVRLGAGDVIGASELYAQALAGARELRSTRLVAAQLAGAARAALLRGELPAARTLLLEFAEIDHDVESVAVGGRALLYRVATLLGDEALARRAKIDETLERAQALHDRTPLGLAAGAALAHAVLSGTDNVGTIANRYIGLLAGAADVAWFADGVARGAPALTSRARALLAAAPPQAAGARAQLLVFDARVALRERRRADAETLARDATLVFKQLGWTLDEAYAREVRGNTKDAIDIFRRCGAAAEVARLTTLDQKQPRRRGETTLTAREREIAGLIGAGKSNREVAEALVISERTVETHVAAVYAKFGVTSRRELAALLAAP